MIIYRVAYIVDSNEYEIFVPEDQLDDVLLGLWLNESAICCIEKW